MYHHVPMKPPMLRSSNFLRLKKGERRRLACARHLREPTEIWGPMRVPGCPSASAHAMRSMSVGSTAPERSLQLAAARQVLSLDLEGALVLATARQLCSWNVTHLISLTIKAFFPHKCFLLSSQSKPPQMRKKWLLRGWEKLVPALA